MCYRAGKMFREIDSTRLLSTSLVREAILGLASSEEVVVFRGGLHEYSKERWIQILRDECKLVFDRRHFDPPTAAKLEPADWWEISYQPDRATTYAYSNTRQPLHTDNAWFGDPAEINFFIMQKQARTGGEQTIYRVSRLVQDLADLEPQLFRDLCTTRVVIQKGDDPNPNHTSVIVLDPWPRIFWNYYRTEKPTRDIQTMCDALFGFLERQETTSSVERLRCESGDCFAFNDLKMLHGRAAFEASRPRERVLLHSMWKLR